MKRIVAAFFGSILLPVAFFSALWSGFSAKNTDIGEICSAEPSYEEVEALFPRLRVSARPRGDESAPWLEVVTPTEGGRLLLRFGNSLLSVPREDLETALPAPQRLRKASDPEIEHAAAVLAPTVKTRYFIWTDLTRLSTYVLEKRENGWRLLRRLPCSAGDAAHPSPEGLFSLGVHRLSFGRAGYYSAAFALQISGNYLYHSVLLSPDGERVIDGRLGERISHGCIRHSLEDSRWLYETVPDGTAILIR